MAAECAICLNSVVEPAPRSAAGSAEVDGALAVDTASLLKRPKTNTTPTLEESTSLEDTFATPCGHIFHAQCLKQVFAEVERKAANNLEAPCPICKRPVTKTSLLQVFTGSGVQEHGVGLDGHTLRSSAASSTSVDLSGSSGSAATNFSGPSMTSSPALSGNRKRHADETLDGTSTGEEQGNGDPDELRDLSDFLIQDYSVLLQRINALGLEEEMDSLDTQVPSVQPNEQSPNSGSDGTQQVQQPGLPGMEVQKELKLQQSEQQGASTSTLAEPQGQGKAVYTCITCESPVETRFHCTVCDDFDQCVGCYEKYGHPHKVVKLGSDSAQEARKLLIQKFLQSISHSVQCQDAACSLPFCSKMKKVVAHAKPCKLKTNGNCTVCKQLIALCCYHAKYCDEIQCLVPFCSNIKQKLRQQQAHKRLQQNQQIRRRVAQMQAMLAQQNATINHQLGMRQLPGNATLGQAIQQHPRQQLQVVGRSVQVPQPQFVLHQQPNQLENVVSVGNPQMLLMRNGIIYASTGNQTNAAMSSQMMQLQIPTGQLFNPSVHQLGFQLNNPTLQLSLQQPGSAHPATSPSQMGPPPS